jgi:hypothetical protein
MHLKLTAGCQISTLIFGLWGTPTHIPWKITEGRQISFPFGIYVKGNARAFNWLTCLGGIMHLKPTAGCRISTLIFGFWGDPIHIPWNITERCLRCIIPPRHLSQLKPPGNTFDLNPKWQRTLPSFCNVSWDMYRVPPKSKYQSWYSTPCCGLEVHYPT